VKGLERIWKQYGGRLAGIAGGLLFGFIYLFMGLWKTLIFGLFVLAGYVVGHWMDTRENLGDVLESIVPDKWFQK